MEFFQSNVHLGEVFVQLLAFVIVFWTLKSLAWEKILKALEARREHIQTELDKIESSKKEIQALKEKYDRSLGQIEEGARAKLQEAVDEGKRVAREIQESARQNAQSVLGKAKEDIQLEIAKAKVALRNEIADLTLRATERLIEEKVDEKKDKEIVLNFIDQLEKVE